MRRLLLALPVALLLCALLGVSLLVESRTVRRTAARHVPGPSPARIEAAAASARDFDVVTRNYESALSALAAAREDLEVQWSDAPDDDAREAVLRDAHTAVFRTLNDDVFPAWLGTRWAFHGTSRVPGKGAIACGYFVATVLEDMGFRVERARLGRQASSRIVRTFAKRSETRWFRGASPGRVVEHVERQGDGLYIVGLDRHVGFLRHDGEETEMCHSSVLWPGTVVCEPAVKARAMRSSVHVVGPVLTEEVLVRWIRGGSFPTWSE